MPQELNFNNHRTPPQIAQVCLVWSLPNSIKNNVLGDLEEEFQQKYLAKGHFIAQSWYVRQALLTSLTYLKQTQRGMIMFAVSIILFISVVVMAFFMSGELSMFINVPSLIVVVPTAIFFSVAATSKQAMINGMKIMLDDQLTLTQPELLSSQLGYKTLGTSAILSGWLGVIIGLVAIASSIKPEIFKDAIGPASAVCLLTILYAYLLKIPCYLVEQKIQNKLVQLNLDSGPTG